MKIGNGNIEGTAEEVNNFFQDNGLKASDFFESPSPPIKTAWLVAPGICVLIALAVLILLPQPQPKYQLLLFVISCFMAIWWAVVLQLRFKNAWATGIVAVGCLLLSLVALGVVTPAQMLEEVKTLKKP